jgi:hypothetical protein
MEEVVRTTARRPVPIDSLVIEFNVTSLPAAGLHAITLMSC